MSKKLISKTVSAMLLTTMSFYTLPVFAFTKDETVYSNLDSKGNSYKTIVSTHLDNKENEKVINDLSDLLSIENTNGDEKFSLEGNNLIWDADGADIYYQGESQKELPIECNIKYELDGKEISADELAGKSGKVKISLEYINKDEHSISINGKTEKLYTPFVVIAGTTIDNKNNSNIEISNGKLVNDGTKTIVLGLALPGMQESLNVSKNTIDIPNNIEITMDTGSFEFNNIVTYVTPKIIEEDDIEFFDKLDEIYNQVNTIKQASKQIEAGASELKEGTDLYSQKSKEFNNAMNEFSSGVSSANNSYTELNKGIDTLNQNTSKIKQGAENLSNGAEKVSTNIRTIATKLGDVQTGITSLQKGEEKLQTGLSTIIKSLDGISVENNSDKIKALNGLKAKNQEQIKTLNTTNTKLKTQMATLDAKDDAELIALLKEQLTNNLTSIGILQANNDTIDMTITSLKGTNLSSVKALKDGINQINEGVNGLSTGTKELYTGVSQIKTGADTLAEKSEELSEGAKTLNEGVKALSKGTSNLATGSSKMKSGLSTLNTSSGKLTDANNELTKGATTLKEGASTLSEGISTFNKEAIDTICSYINGDLKGIQTRVEKLQELANKYNNFTMLNDGTAGNVKFIMIIDSIKKQESQTNKQEIILNDGKTEEKEEQ